MSGTTASTNATALQLAQHEVPALQAGAEDAVKYLFDLGAELAADWNLSCSVIGTGLISKLLKEGL